ERVLARYGVERLDLGQLEQPLHQALGGLAGLRSDHHERADRQSDGAVVQHRAVAEDHARLFQFGDALADGRRREADKLGDAGMAGAAVLPEYVEDLAIYRVEV